MPGMDGGADAAAVMTMSFRDHSRPAVHHISAAATATDKNGNSLPALTFTDLTGYTTSDNVDAEVETGHRVRRTPVRKISVGDLHIRSRDDDRLSACREIRAILREIRDSLQVETSSASSTNVSADQQEAPSHPAVVRRPRDPQRPSNGWKESRLSLPARLRPGQLDGLTQADMNGFGTTRAGRRRVPVNVRFADEVGLNLNTFAMIPPRQVRDDSPTCVPLPRFNPNCSTRRRVRSPPPPFRPHDPLDNGPSSPETEDDRQSELKERRLEEETHERFRLCFQQPFADLDKFKCRLDRQMVCLENVRVDDWTPHHHASASNSASESAAVAPSAANSVILCSIQTKARTTWRGAETTKVFARCTSDNWRTFADLPAQHVTGLDNLGLGYDRYCFAVRRPSSSSDGPREAAVELAVCYEAADTAYWDNNDMANYRIEWFDNVT